MLEQMEENVRQLESNPEEASKYSLMIALHRLELHRLRYQLTSYYRTRLLKVERFAASLLRDANRADRMSQEEMEHAEQHVRLYQRHIDACRGVDEIRALLSDARRNPAEELDRNRFVFVRALRECRGVAVDDSLQSGASGNEDLERGSQHLLRYRFVKHLIEDGSVQLI